MKDPTAERADRIRDRIAIDRITLDHPSLPVAFSGPDRAAFWFIDNVPPEVNREAVAMAKRVLGDAFGVTFGDGHDEWTPNGARRQYEVKLKSGLLIVITAKACDMPDEDGAEVRELAEMAA